MQRLRIRFSRGVELKFISHLDRIRLWERALRRARVQLAYSEGFSPHPQRSLAAPLSVGITSDAELMDIQVTGRVSPHWLAAAVNQQLPPGIEVREVRQIAPLIPSLQSQVRFAEYEVDLGDTCGVGDARSDTEIDQAIDDLLAREELPWHHRRDTGRRDYDLRRLIDDIRRLPSENGVRSIAMRLRCDSSGSGRPEQVAAALGFAEPPRAIRRTGLILGTGRRPDRVG